MVAQALLLVALVACSHSVTSPCEQLRPALETFFRKEVDVLDVTKSAPVAERQRGVVAAASAAIDVCTSDRWTQTTIDCLEPALRKGDGSGDRCLTPDALERQGRASEAALASVFPGYRN
jgi:hypothetical protein